MTQSHYVYNSQRLSGGQPSRVYWLDDMGVKPGGGRGGQCPPNNWSAGDRPPQYFPQIVCRKPVIYLKLYIATICSTADEGAVVGEQMRVQSVGLYKPQ